MYLRTEPQSLPNRHFLFKVETQEQFVKSGFNIVNFEQISYIVLVLPFLALYN